MTTRLFRFALPLVLLLAGSLLIWGTDADLRLAGAVYASGGWPGNGNAFWEFVYSHASYPAFVLVGLGVIILVAGFFVPRLAAERKAALFLVLLLVLGPGLVVNALLKDNLGRPRPIDVQEFGGDFPYAQFWQHGISHDNRSFPSGHASVAFYLFAPWFILRGRRRVAAACWLAGGLGYGLLVGIGRMLQGGHFLSDVLWAGGLVYLTGELLTILLGLDSPAPARAAPASS